MLFGDNTGAAATPPADPSKTAAIRDVNEADFMAEVVERSMEVPVIVDFWAPWCGPCKTLGPALEAEVTRAKGRVAMAKINVDQNQSLAAQMRVQSIPTVYAFWKGQPVDAFQGALPASELRKFVDKLTELSGDDGGLGEALAAAESMLEEGSFADAAEIFAAIIGEDPENAEAWGGLVRAHLAAGATDRAQEALDQVPAGIARTAPVEAARAQLQLALQAEKAGPLDELRARVEADPGDQQARFDLATALHASGSVEEAVDQLLEAFRRDRDWNDGAAKAQLITIFDALKPTDPIAQKGRRRLSSLIFA